MSNRAILDAINRDTRRSRHIDTLTFAGQRSVGWFAEVALALASGCATAIALLTLPL